MQLKNRSELAKTQFRPRPVQRLKKTFFSPGLVFLVLRNVWTGLGLSLFFWAKKPDWTGLSSTKQDAAKAKGMCFTLIKPKGNPAPKAEVEGFSGCHS